LGKESIGIQLFIVKRLELYFIFLRLSFFVCVYFPFFGFFFLSKKKGQMEFLVVRTPTVIRRFYVFRRFFLLIRNSDFQKNNAIEALTVPIFDISAGS